MIEQPMWHIRPVVPYRRNTMDYLMVATLDAVGIEAAGYLSMGWGVDIVTGYRR